MAAPLGVALALAAVLIDPGTAAETVERLAPAEAAEAQKGLLVPPPFDLSVLYVTRLSIDGQRFEVTSLGPTTVAEESNGAHWAVSVLAYAPDKSALVLFSRDPGTGTGYRLALPVREVAEGLELRFPILKSQTLEEATVRINAQLRVPEE